VRTVWSLGEADEIAFTKLALSLGRPERRPPGHAEQPLLVSVLVVVRERPLARLELIEARADQLTACVLSAPAPPLALPLGDPVAVVVEVQLSPSQ
jgi:hypothetical protein